MINEERDTFQEGIDKIQEKIDKYRHGTFERRHWEKTMAEYLKNGGR
ncbi:MAG: hypothetical protein WCF32_09780 [Methanoregula sp.]|jgi:hypothetical protein